MTALFLDILPLSQQATNDTLEYIFKANVDNNAGIWQPHESLLVQKMIELFTQRGLARLDAVMEQLIAWEDGAYYKELPAKITPPGMLERWNEHERGLVRLYLESLFPGSWTIDDHMLAIELIMQTYLPTDELKAEADWLATKATLMGKVQANMDAAKLTSSQADAILAGLPSTMASAFAAFSLSGHEKFVLQFAAARAAENVVALASNVRHAMRSTILQHLEDKQTTAAGVGGQALQQKLFDRFASLNRDWRRIAVTEAGEAQTQGYIASLKPGTKVKRVEVYASACNFCKKIHGVIATVVSPDHPNKREDMVWPGKNNIGRSASPKKRVGDVLVPRTPDEMWWLPAGLAHPHCRGFWAPVAEVDGEGLDPDFTKWLKATLAES